MPDVYESQRERIVRACIDGLLTLCCMAGLMGLFSLLGLLDDRMTLGWALGSFGASMTLILGAPESRLGTPRHAIIGNTGSAIIGCMYGSIFPDLLWCAALCTITTAIAFMSITRTMHPPGGASALLALFGGEPIESLGWLYPFCPVLVGTLWILLVANLRTRVKNRGRSTQPQ